MEALIEELPKFRLKAVPTDCSECPICLDEFHVGNEVIYFLRLTVSFIEVGKLVSLKNCQFIYGFYFTAFHALSGTPSYISCWNPIFMLIKT